MQTLKCFAVVAVATCIAMSSYAQVDWNIFGGPQLTTASYTAQSVKQKTSYKTGFNLGVGMKVPFEGNLYFSPELAYTMTGYKVTYNRFVYPPGPDALDNNVTFHTLQAAFLLQYDFGAQPSHFFMRLGPSLDFQFLGHEKFTTNNNGVVSRSTPFGFDKYGRFSANAIGQLGFETSGGFSIRAQYSYGLASINNADGGPRIRHRVFGITFGKTLGPKKIVVDTRNKE